MEWSQELIIGSISVLAGAYTMYHVIKKTEYFFSSRRVQRVAKLMGIKGARIFYGGIATLLLYLGTHLLLTLR